MRSGGYRMELKSPWLPGYAWPVHRAHADFVGSNCFDPGSLFHSDVIAHRETWEWPPFSVRVVKCAGSPGVRAAESNAALTLICDLHDWMSGRTERLCTTNGALIALLRTGDVEQLRSGAAVV